MIEVLQEIGLTEKEAEVYVALTKMGSASATEIMQETGLHRAVIYDVLERLIEKGLAGSVIGGRKKIFEAVSPKRLLEMLKEKERKVETILPSLLEMSSFNSPIDTKIYKGKEGIKTVLEEVLSEKEWLVIGSSGSTYKLMPYFLEQFHRRRVKRHIKVRGLLVKGETSKKRYNALRELECTELRFLPEQFKTPTVMNIYGSKVAMYNTANGVPFIVLIENPEFAQSFREYFDWLWSHSC